MASDKPALSPEEEAQRELECVTLGLRDCEGDMLKLTDTVLLAVVVGDIVGEGVTEGLKEALPE